MLMRALIVCSSDLIERYSRMVFWLNCAVGNTTRSPVSSVSGKWQLRDAVPPGELGRLESNKHPFI